MRLFSYGKLCRTEGHRLCENANTDGALAQRKDLSLHDTYTQKKKKKTTKGKQDQRQPFNGTLSGHNHCSGKNNNQTATDNTKVNANTRRGGGGE
jgi:hypothetical protein